MNRHRKTHRTIDVRKVRRAFLRARGWPRTWPEYKSLLVRVRRWARDTVVLSDLLERGVVLEVGRQQTAEPSVVRNVELVGDSIGFALEWTRYGAEHVAFWNRMEERR